MLLKQKEITLSKEVHKYEQQGTFRPFRELLMVCFLVIHVHNVCICHHLIGGTL